MSFSEVFIHPNEVGTTKIKAGVLSLHKLPGGVQDTVPLTISILSSAPQLKSDFKAILTMNLPILYAVWHGTDNWGVAHNYY